MPISTATLNFEPIGLITLYATSEGISRVIFGKGNPVETDRKNIRLVEMAAEQIQEYLLGKRESFELPLDWQTISAFQKKALKACAAIPYGQHRTYGELAREIGAPKAARAVGMAMSRNPLPLIIPCHRVIGSDGSLHGFAAPGGVRIKAWLLNMEGALLVR